MIDTPNANRLHISIFGRTNSGKSSLINSLTGHEVSIVSDVAGTTTDPVKKAMEISGLGACVLIDTAGFDDTSPLGKMRIEKTKEIISNTDIAIVVFSIDDISLEKEWIELIKSNKTPVVACISKCDVGLNDNLIANIKRLELDPILFSAKDPKSKNELIQALIRALPQEFATQSITGSLVNKGDSVLLVMPQDIQAPKGRLILPQVQTIRDLLDNSCTVTSTTLQNLDNALSQLKNPPHLIITDSQVFPQVYEKKPQQSKLTSFSILFAQYKGDIKEFISGAKALHKLTSSSRILIAEACTHAPMQEDIGRVKIPKLLKARFGDSIVIDVVSGTDFPNDLSSYNLIIHCGACMFNRKYVLSRINQAKSAQVPITNYGVVLAELSGILEKINL